MTLVSVKLEAGDGAQDAPMFPPPADQLSADISTTFTLVPNNGQGDCAYIAVGMAITDASGADLVAPKFKPGSEIQAQLRRFTAK